MRDGDAEDWVDRMIYHRIRPGSKGDPPDYDAEEVAA